MSSSVEINEDERQELLALYQATTQDLSFFKSQQWAITNYALIAFAAIIGVPQLAKQTFTPCVRTLLIGAAIAMTVLSTIVLYRLKRSIDDRRARLDRVYDRFSDEFKNARGTKKKVSSEEMFVFLIALILVGAFIASWLIYVA